MSILLATLSLLGAAATASEPSPAKVSTAPIIIENARPRHSLVELHDNFLEATDDNSRGAALKEISQTRPETQRDVSSLFDLFMRFPDGGARNAVMDSIGLLGEADTEIEPAFLAYLQLPESEAKMLGIAGALRLHSLRALPLIRKIAEKRFGFKSPGEAPILADKNAWWTQYDALSALAQWQGASVFPLLRRKADEAPSVARLMATFLWKESLPQIAQWARAGNSAQEQTHEALTADVPWAALRATRAQMLAFLRDPKAPRELRHYLSIKVGFSSTPEEIDALLTEEGSAKDPEIRLSLSAALFASRSPKTIPWLKELRDKSPDVQLRIGALLQLREILPSAELRPLIEDTAAHDPDPENRQTATKMLQTATQYK